MKDLGEILGGEAAPSAEPEIKEEVRTEEAATDDRPEGQSEGADGATVPVAALQAERHKAKTYREQVAEFDKRLAEQNAAWEQRFSQLFASLQPQQQAQPQQPPDFWEAPETAIDHRLQPLHGQMAQMQDNLAKIEAFSEHGRETVEAAYNELAGMLQARDPAFAAEYQSIMSSPRPYSALVQWHKKRSALAEIGDDPAAFREKIKAELLQELQAGAPPSAPSMAAPTMPSNFATSRNVGSRSGPAWGGPMSVADIFKR